MLEIKNSINQIKTTEDNIISRQDQAEERISKMEDKIEEILHTDSQKIRNECL
jgi:TolA-binding protein